MKTGNGFVEGRSRIIGQLVLEFAQCFCHSAEVCLTADLLQTDGALHKVVDTPGTALSVQVAGAAGQGGDHVQGLTHGVAALRQDLAAQVPGDAADVLHQAHRVREGVGVDALQDEPLGVVGTPDQIGVVDMAFAVMAAVADHRSAKIKGVCCCQENGFCYRFHDVILVSLSFMPFCRSRAFSLPCLTAVFVGGQPFRLAEALGKVAGG